MRRILALAPILLATSLLPGGMPAGAAPAAHAPAFDHIFVILEENQDESQIVGNSQLSFINDVLIERNFRQTNYFALNHGSLPDYLGLISGSQQHQVIGDPPGDCTPRWDQRPPSCAVTAPWPSNLADTIEASGRTWRGYFQSMGWPCRWESNDPKYDVTHNPFVYFKTVQGGGPVSSQRCREHDVDLLGDSTHTLAADLRSEATTPNFVFIMPDNAHNMHDGDLPGADRFLEDLLTGSNHSGLNGDNPINIFNSPAWTAGRSIAYVLWDEDAGSFWNQVPAIAIGNWVNGPVGRDGMHFNHYSMLRTWEAAWHLAPIGPGDRAAAPMLGAFNLVDADAGPQPRGNLRADHPEVYARVEVNVRSPGATVALLSLRDEAGNVFRVVLGHDGRLAFENGAAAAPTVLASAQGLGSGWHTVTLHVWERGARGTCEVFYDGDPVAGLDLMSSCPTGSTMIRSYAIGPPGGGSGSVQFRNPALATSPL